MSLSSGGAGGDDGDTSKQDAVETVESSDTSGGDGLSATDIARIVRSLLPWWVLNPPKALQAFVRRPFATVLTIVVGFVFQDIVKPIVEGILQAGLAVVGAILLVGQSVVTIGTVLIQALVGGFAPVGLTVLSTLGQVNGAIAQAAATGGLGAPTIVALLWGLEIGVAGWGAWSVVQVIDIPGVSLSGTLRVVSAPFKLVVTIIR